MKTIAKLVRLRGGLAALLERPIRIENGPFMPLSIEHAGPGPGGNPLIAVSHTYLQNGDVMEDPGMTFSVCPREDEAAIAAGLSWICGDWAPASFTQHNLGIYREAIFVAADGRLMQRPGLVADLARFARQWDRNIKAQGYAERLLPSD